MKRIPDPTPPRRPAYFWWLLANLLAACFAVLSWVVCLYVFRHIEVPRNYELLEKLGRLPERRAITAEQAPNGNAMGPPELYQKFFGMAADDLARYNNLLLRNYLDNSSNPLILTYVEGNYRVNSLRELGADDFISPGLVVGAQAMVKPKEDSPPAPYPVWIEQVLPDAPATAAALFQEGSVLELRKSPSCVSVVHVARVKINGDDALWITAIPIVTGPYQEVGGKRSFTIGLPGKIRPRAGLPILKPPQQAPAGDKPFQPDQH